MCSASTSASGCGRRTTTAAQGARDRAVTEAVTEAEADKASSAAISIRQFVRELLAHRTLSLRDGSPRLALPLDVRAWAVDLSESWIEELQARKYDAVGSLDEQDLVDLAVGLLHDRAEVERGGQLGEVEHPVDLPVAVVDVDRVLEKTGGVGELHPVAHGGEVKVAEPVHRRGARIGIVLPVGEKA